MSAALPFDDSTHAKPWPLPRHENLHPVFAGILQAIEAQPAMLERAAAKADGRRFTGEPPTGFGELPVEFQAEVEPELRPEFAQAIRLIRAGQLEPRHCDIQALLGLLCTLAADAAKAGHQGYEDVSEHLDAAHGALDNCYGASA